MREHPRKRQKIVPLCDSKAKNCFARVDSRLKNLACAPLRSLRALPDSLSRSGSDFTKLLFWLVEVKFKKKGNHDCHVKKVTVF